MRIHCGRTVAGLLAIACGVAACHRAPSLAANAPEASAPWVTIHRSGGIAGMTTVLSITNGGAFSMVTRRGCAVATCAPTDSSRGTISADSLATLHRLIERVPSAAMKDYLPSRGWADQYMYAVELTRGDTVLTANGDEGSLPLAISEFIERAFGLVQQLRQ